ncbi:MAG TPA: hypothetical protein VJ739_10155 [Gemmataceae bacterium]|nr:hypothetical protein [Gemmataceae bacterium]
MQVELTAIYEEYPGGVRAYIAEIESIRTLAKTREEARANLVARVRLYWESERARAFAYVRPEARVEPIRVEVPTIEGTGAEAAAALPRDAVWRYEDVDLFQTLLEQGRIDAIPPPGRIDTDQVEPVRIEGKPISQEIIEDRR